MDELPECIKGPVLQDQNYRTSTAQVSYRIPERSPSEAPGLMDEQKPEASYQTKESLQGTSASQEVRTKGILWDTP